MEKLCFHHAGTHHATITLLISTDTKRSKLKRNWRGIRYAQVRQSLQSIYDFNRFTVLAKVTLFIPYYGAARTYA